MSPTGSCRRLAGCWLAIALGLSAAWAADFVIAVSVDGLGTAYLQPLVDAGRLPAFKRLQAEAAWTGNARNDVDITVTLPNHVSMLTSRPILGEAGHGWTHNTDPAKGETLHTARGAYVAGAFDVAHDAGRRTGLWASKTRFSLFSVSWDARHGAPDATGEDNGRNKVDLAVYGKSSPRLVDDFLAAMRAKPCHFAFVHFTEGDSAGHAEGWGSEDYAAALVLLDGCVGRIMDLIATDKTLAGRTTLIVTADHGGLDNNHAQADEPAVYTVPFFAWGAGVSPGDLYAMNPSVRRAPGSGRPSFAEVPQPVRSGEVGNLALSLLGLGPIPGSVFDKAQDLRVAVPEASGKR